MIALAAILTILGLFIAFLSGGILEKNILTTIGLFILSFSFVMLGIIFLTIETNKESYKQGQIDAINGKIKYKIQIDSSQNWVKIKQ